MHQSLLTLILLIALGVVSAAGNCSGLPSMLATNSPNTNQQWHAVPLLTVGDQFEAYMPPGRLDGIGALPQKEGVVRIFVNHEMASNKGYAYKLANGTELTGARISFFDIRTDNYNIINAGLAYDTIYDREAKPVSQASQVNEKNDSSKGLTKFCSGRSIQAGNFAFVDDIFFTGEEAKKNKHPHGGTIWALDVRDRTLHAAPALGRGSWENVTPLETGNNETVALLMGDDMAPAPLYLYLGKKNLAQNTGFLERNGLTEGQLYCWKSDAGHINPQNFNKSKNRSHGRFVPLEIRQAEKAGHYGYDGKGYLDSNRLRQAGFNKGCFQFSRPEDLHNDPANPTHAVFSSTGYGDIHPADDWGTLYFISLNFDGLTAIHSNGIAAELMIAYDSDEDGRRDMGIRSPDNLTWADNGLIYVQEDSATRLSTFGANGIESSIWQFDPKTLTAERIAEINRKAVVPIGATDKNHRTTGTWESSGIVDVTGYLDTHAGETLLLTTVQAHKVNGGPVIGGAKRLVESGQLILLTNKQKRQ